MKHKSTRFILFISLIFLLIMGGSSGAFADEAENTDQLLRLYGNDRYETSIKTADYIKTVLSIDKFENIIVAYGGNFPDALSGNFLSKEKNAPIILVNPSKEAMVRDYILENLAENGTVYLLGGEAVVRKEFEENLIENLGFDHVKRLSGEDRYKTNIAILEECGTGFSDLLIATGENYPDSLSASSAGRPVLLTSGSFLTVEQSCYLDSLKERVSHIYALGGESVVSNDVINNIQMILSDTAFDRLWGENRCKTSAAIANAFFPNADTVILTVSNNFPDSLCAGLLGNKLHAPILLVNANNIRPIQAYTTQAEVNQAIIIGGKNLLSDNIALNSINVVVKQGSMGVDVSEWQYIDIDWNTAHKNGIDFAILRAGYGHQTDDYKDVCFEKYYQSASAAGMPVGVYWYTYAVNAEEAATEANLCLSVLNNRPVDLPVALDIEDVKQRDLPNETVMSIIVTFCEKIKAAGYRPMVYSFLNFFDTKIDYEQVKDYELWIADWYSEGQLSTLHPTGTQSDYEHPHGLWQYYNRGYVPGISSDKNLYVDMNYAVTDILKY